MARQRGTRQFIVPESSRTAGLTIRQAEVLELAAHGLSGKQIGRYLGISARTVEGHFLHEAGPDGTGRGRIDGCAGASERDETCPVSSPCRVCGTPVTVAATGRPRAYCSQACKARAYRARQHAASCDSHSYARPTA